MSPRGSLHASWQRPACTRLSNRAILLHCICRLLAVRLEGANHQWRKIPPGELSIDPEDEILSRDLRDRRAVARYAGLTGAYSGVARLRESFLSPLAAALVWPPRHDPVSLAFFAPPE